MCSPDAPDTSKQQEAALQMSQLSKEQLEWAKQIYAETAPDRANAIQRANAVSDAQLESMNTQTALAKDYDAYNKSTFRPLEQGIVADASTYDTPERREAEAAKATAGVEMSLASQRGATMREQERAGVNPASGKIAAMQGVMDLGAAKLKAGAASAARTQVETVGQARKMDAANLGRGLASSQATSAGLALTAGNNSASNAASTGGITAQGAALMNSGYSGAQQGLSNAAQTYGAIANTQAQSSDSGMWGALGSVAGSFAGSANGSKLIASAFSDVNMKEDIAPANDEESLDAIRNTPVALWRYKEDSPAADGGQPHIGPMAQDLHAAAGDGVAPGGKAIDLISANGLTMGAVRALDEKVNVIAAQIGANLDGMRGPRKSMASNHGAYPAAA